MGDVDHGPRDGGVIADIGPEDEDQIPSAAREKINRYRRERYAKDGDFREKCKNDSKAWKAKRMADPATGLEFAIGYNKYMREYMSERLKDPEKRILHNRSAKKAVRRMRENKDDGRKVPPVQGIVPVHF